MSLAATVDLGRADVRQPLGAILHAALAALLIAATLEQRHLGPLTWAGTVASAVAIALAVAAAVVSALRAARRWRTRTSLREQELRILPDGSVELGGLPARVTIARRLPGSLYLAVNVPAARGVTADAGRALRAQSGKPMANGGRYLLACRRVDAAQWAALARWVVWRRRGGGTPRNESDNAF